MSRRRPKLATKWKKNLTEEILASHIVDWLEARGWDVYQEVQLYSAYGVADIVAVKDKIHWTIEVKRAFGFKVLDQAQNWKPFSHKVSIAVPSKRFLGVEYQVLKMLGIGMFIIGPDEHMTLAEDVIFAQEIFEAVEQKGPIRLPKLLPEHKEMAKAGSAGGGYVTPFRLTRIRLVESVTENPGRDIVEVMEGIEHHYRNRFSARRSIMDLISKKVIHELRFEKAEGGKVLMYPAGVEDQE